MRTGICNFVYGGKRTKSARARWEAWTAGGWKDAENLIVPESLRTGTGAIRQESFMLSHLSAPQAQCVRHFAWPVLRNFGTLRFSRIFSDARRPRLPPAPGWFLAVASGKLFDATISYYTCVLAFLPVILLFNSSLRSQKKSVRGVVSEDSYVCRAVDYCGNQKLFMIASDFSNNTFELLPQILKTQQLPRSYRVLLECAVR